MKHIYATSPDPHFCAMALDNKMLERSIKDGVRVGSNVISRLGGQSLYVPDSNPSEWELWAGENYNNFSWFLSHLIYLSTEWKSRGERGWHPSHKTILDLAKQRSILASPENPPQTYPPNCTAYKNIMDPMVAYRLHLSVKWAEAKEAPVWGKAGPPPWIVKASDLQRILEKLECN